MKVLTICSLIIMAMGCATLTSATDPVEEHIYMSGHTTFKAKVQGAMTQVEPEDNDDPLFAVNYYKIQWILKAGGVGLGIGGLVGAYQYWTILQATMNPFNFIKCLKSAAPLAAVTGALGAGYGYVISELGYLR